MGPMPCTWAFILSGSLGFVEMGVVEFVNDRKNSLAVFIRNLKRSFWNVWCISEQDKTKNKFKFIIVFFCQTKWVNYEWRCLFPGLFDQRRVWFFWECRVFSFELPEGPWSNLFRSRLPFVWEFLLSIHRLNVVNVCFRLKNIKFRKYHLILLSI